MRLSKMLFQQACRVTLFTNPNCSLCDTAKAVLAKVRARRQFELKELHIHQAGNEQWRDVYAFDTPVLHFQTSAAAEKGETTAAAQKLMHRFTEQEIESKLDALSTG